MDLKELRSWTKNKGFMQFAKKTGIFIGLFLLMPIVLFPLLEFSRYGKGEDPLPFFLVDVGAGLLFISMAFFFLARNKLKTMKAIKHSYKDTIVFGFLTLLGLSGYLFLRYFTSHNVGYTFEHRAVFVTLILAFLLISFGFLALAVYGRRFLINFFRMFKKELLISVGMIVVYYIITINLRKSWFFLGDFVANSVAWLLRLSFDSVVLKNMGYNYTLGAEGFIARIGELCSGIDSMTLFLGLFVLILSVDWKRIDKKRMAILFVPGLIGTVFVNILRIYLLYLSGIYVSPKFAVGLFHSNAGWLLFIIYFLIFWYFAYPWVTRRDKKNK